VNLDATVAKACERIPGMVRGALVFLPDGFILAGAGDDDILDLEPLIRASARCLGAPAALSLDGVEQEILEYLLVVHDQLIVIRRSAREPRLALAVSCTREHNMMFAVTASRLAMAEIEEHADLAPWGI
jgi:hypothetical protein